MLYRWRSRMAKRWFDWRAGPVHTTPALECGASPVTFVSQVQSGDLRMYLLAVKSLGRFVRPCRVVALDDGTLTADDRGTLLRHVPGIEIVPIAAVDTGTCPRGGTWERLLYIVDLSRSAYVLQLDSDTLTLRCPSEVVDCIRDRVSFTQGTGMGRRVVSMVDAAAYTTPAPVHARTHVQLAAEAHFVKLRGHESLRYIRGCSGFAGFAPGAVSRQFVEEFSRNMEHLIGRAKWNEWGSEQSMSNVAIANSPGARVLPFPQYGYYHEDLDVDAATFIHFMGSYRFANGTYARIARRVVRELCAG